MRPLVPALLLAVTLVGSVDSAEENVRSIAYATRFGGSQYDMISNVVTDKQGNLYITGTTRSADLPMKNPLQNAIGGDEGTSSAFVAKIDPTGELLFSTYFGGSSDDSGYDIDVDQTGAVFVTGSTTSRNLPTTSGVIQAGPACPNELRWCADSFLLKLSPTGRLLMATYLGFGNTDVPRLAVGADGGIYLGGTARSRLDERGRMAPGSVSGGYHGFVAKLRADGTAYEYVTHIDSSGLNYVEAITVDSNGRAYVGGRDGSTCALKATPGAFRTPEGCLFVARLAADHGSVEWLSRFGGTDDGADYYSYDTPSAYISDIAVDAQSSVYITGATSNRDFPTTSDAAQTALHVRRTGGSIYDGFDAFVTKLTADGSALSYSTFLGGSSGDFASRLAVDAAGLVHVAGVSDSEDMAGRSYTISRDRGQLFCCWDAFAARMNADGSAFLDLNVFGGSFSDGAQGIAVSPQGLVWMAGYAFSPDLPTTPAAEDPAPRERSDGFVVKLPWRGTPRLAR